MTSNRDSALSALFDDEARGDARAFLLSCFDYAASRSGFFERKGAEKEISALIEETRLQHGIEELVDPPHDSSSSDEEDTDSMTSKEGSDVPATPALYDETTIEEVADDVVEKRNVNVDEKKTDADDADNENKTSSSSAFRKPNAGNGLDLDTYSWIQTLAEVVICVPLVKGAKAKDCEVKIAKDSLRVAIRGGGATASSSSSSSSSSSDLVPILDGPLEASVKPADCFWNILDGQTLEITLTKNDGMRWWSRVVVSDNDDDAKVDTSKVEPENSKLGDLDAETRATVEKMMWDQRQKALGLPTSEEVRKAQILEKFKAQHPELDFSQAKIG